MRLDRTERFYVFRYPGASSRSSVPVDAQWEIRGGQIPQPSKTISRFGGLRDDLPCSSRPPDEHVFGVGRFFRTVADEDGQISLPADLETIAEKLGLQTEMR